MKSKIYLPKTIDELKEYPEVKLIELWKRYFDNEFLGIKKSLYRGLWYKIQCENMNLKLGQKYITKLNRYSQNPEASIEKSYKTKYHIKSGSQIIKNYKEKTFIVNVIEEGKYEYTGSFYKTLSAVALSICGKKVSGYDFFGLNNKHVNKDVINEES